MYGVKGKLSRTYFGEMESFFSSLDFVTQYFVDIFSESPKSLFTNKFWNYSIFNKMSQKIIDLLDLFIKITGIKGQLSGSSLMDLGSLFGFFNVFSCIYRVIYLSDLSAGFITKKSPNSQFFLENKMYYC